MTLRLRDDRYYAPRSAAAAADGQQQSCFGDTPGNTGPLPLLQWGGSGTALPAAPCVVQPGPGILPVVGGGQLRQIGHLEFPALAALATGAGITFHLRDSDVGGGETIRRVYFDKTGTDPNPFAPLAATKCDVSAATTPATVATAAAATIASVIDITDFQAECSAPSGDSVFIDGADDGEVTIQVELTSASGIVFSNTQLGAREVRLAPMQAGPLRTWAPCASNLHMGASPG